MVSRHTLIRLAVTSALAAACSISMSPSGIEAGNSKGADMPAQLLFKKLNTALQQGNETAARSIIIELAALKKPAATFELSQAANSLIDRKRWDLAKLFLEKFPQAEPGWGYLLVKHWAAEAGKDAASITAIDDWLKQRAESKRQYWTDLRFTLAVESNRKDKFFDELETACKNNPDDLDGVKIYLYECDREATKRNVSWITKTINPKRSYDNYRLADWLHSSRPSEATHYLEKCRTMNFTDADAKAIFNFARQNWAMSAAPSYNWRTDFSIWVRSMLAECYQKTGESKKAQSLLVELSKEEKGGAPRYAMSQLAGQVQSTTPTHPLEDQIKKAEPGNENSVNYWQGRAQYYEGRKDTANQKQALDKALNLCKLNADADQSKIMERSIVVWDYARFLRSRDGGDSAALSFLWNEFSSTSNIDYQTRILNDISNQLETDITGYLTPVDERLWTFLSRRKEWDLFDERILWRMARNAKDAGARNTFFLRAEKLATGVGSRELYLGWVLNRCAEPKQSIAILQSACHLLHDEKRKDAYFTLFESYLDLSDWKNAESIWPQASTHLTEHEQPDWMGRIALAAAKSGDKQSAMRLWKKKDLIDFAALQHLDDMAKYGMKPDLIGYYTRLQKKKPDSTVPNEALQKLKAYSS